MNRQVKALLISFTLHTLIIGSITFIGESFPGLSSNVVIDLALLDSNGADAAVIQKTTESERRSRSIPARLEGKQRTTAPQQLPVTEVSGTVPVLQNQWNTVPVAAKPLWQETGSAVIDQPVLSSKGRIATNISETRDSSGKTFAQLRQRYISEHFAYIKEMIQNNLTYPHMAKKFRWTGKVIVSFIVFENGHADHIKILKSSGHDMLDNNVIHTIEAISPFPKPPVKAELRMPIIYQIE